MKRTATVFMILSCILILAACSSGASTEVKTDHGNEPPVADAATDPDDIPDDLSWWQKTNAYEVYVNSFQDTDGNGYGDINGITEHLDHFENLGVGAVWLTPVFVSPMKDNGYDVADYYTINPLYGSNEDMDRLLEEAGQKGIRIGTELVYYPGGFQKKE